MVKLEKAKGNFFDRQVILAPVEKATHAALNKGGALIRTIMKRSIRPGGKAGKVSEPGQPPRSQTGLLRKIIYVHVPGKLAGQGVWVGPMLLNVSKGTAPENLEFGATVHVAKGTPMRIKAGRNSKGHFQADRVVPGPARTIKIAARPYLGPALDTAVGTGNLPDLWKSATLGGG